MFYAGQVVVIWECNLVSFPGRMCILQNYEKVTLTKSFPLLYLCSFFSEFIHFSVYQTILFSISASLNLSFSRNSTVVNKGCGYKKWLYIRIIDTSNQVNIQYSSKTRPILTDFSSVWPSPSTLLHTMAYLEKNMLINCVQTYDFYVMESYSIPGSCCLLHKLLSHNKENHSRTYDNENRLCRTIIHQPYYMYWCVWCFVDNA